MKHTFAFLILLFALGTSSFGADLNIGTVDAQKVVEKYWRTKQIQADMEKEQDAVTQKLESFQKDQVKLQKEIEDQSKFIQSNPNLPEAQLQARIKQRADNIRRFQEMARAISQYQQATQKKIQEKWNKETSAIITEIKSVVAAQAKKDGYNLVLDSSSADPLLGATPTVLFSDDSNDITTVVLEKLNASDPNKSKAPGNGK